VDLIREISHGVGRWGVILALCSLTNSAWAADKKDWLDEMPSVSAVVQAVGEEHSTAQLADDEDLLAADIVGTLMLLRWIMLLQALEEGGASPPRLPTAKWVMENASAGLEKLSKSPRFDKLQSMESTYMQAELVIGRGTGKHRYGYLSLVRKCDCSPNDNFSMRVANQTLGCYRYWFHNLLGNIYPSLNHRRQILPKLFPRDRAQHYIDLVTRYVLAAPSLYEPATTLSMPPGSGYPMPRQDYCKTYGSDSNGNGLCDDWEKSLSKTARLGSSPCKSVAGVVASSAGGNSIECKDGVIGPSDALTERYICKPDKPQSDTKVQFRAYTTSDPAKLNRAKESENEFTGKVDGLNDEFLFKQLEVTDGTGKKMYGKYALGYLTFSGGQKIDNVLKFVEWRNEDERRDKDKDSYDYSRNCFATSVRINDIWIEERDQARQIYKILGLSQQDKNKPTSGDRVLWEKHAAEVICVSRSGKIITVCQKSGIEKMKTGFCDNACFEDVSKKWGKNEYEIWGKR
jgi:hypothetical protein